MLASEQQRLVDRAGMPEFAVKCAGSITGLVILQGNSAAGAVVPFEKPELKATRNLLDCRADDQGVGALVGAERPDFTDYLNFFEFVAYLRKSKQLDDDDTSALFDY
jgi:hypothetical protein